MTAPHITTEYDCDYECFRLMATSYLKTEPAGPRLFRGGELPDIQFTHETKEAAERDCLLLQSYVLLAWGGKSRKAKRGAEEAEIETEMSVDTTNAIWNL